MHLALIKNDLFGARRCILLYPSNIGLWVFVNLLDKIFFFQDTAAGSATAGAIILIGLMAIILMMKKRFVIL